MDKMRFIFESPYRTVEVSSSSDETWMEHIDMFIDFLRGCGYVVDDQAVADYLMEFTGVDSIRSFDDDLEDEEVVSWSFEDSDPAASTFTADTIPRDQDNMNTQQTDYVFAYDSTVSVNDGDNPVTFTIRR